MHTNNPRYSDRKCAAYPRAVKIVYGPGDEETGPVFINVREIANTTFQIPIGTTVARILRIGDARCDGLAFTPILGNGTDTNGADHVNVTRLDASTWSVETRPYPDNQAYCPATGQLYHIDVRFLVVTDRPLP